MMTKLRARSANRDTENGRKKRRRKEREGLAGAELESFSGLERETAGRDGDLDRRGLGAAPRDNVET